MGLGALAASIGMSAASSAASTAFNIGPGLISQKQQYGYQKQWARKSPGYHVRGLKDAGLNPVLAAGSFGSGSGGNVSGFSASAPDIARSMSNISSAKLNKAQIDLVNEQRGKVEDERYKVRNETAVASAMATILGNKASRDIMSTDEYIRMRKVLPKIQAFSEAGGSTTFNSALQLFKLFK